MKIKIGDSAHFTKAFTQEEHERHLKCINDQNPIHYDYEYAKQTRFKEPIVQGALTSSLISGILGTTLPGKDTIYLGQTYKFLRPIFLNEKVKAEVRVIHIRDDKPIVKLSTKVFKENGELSIDGEAIVKVPQSMIK